MLCRVSLFLSMALCLLLRLFVFRLLRLKRFSTLFFPSRRRNPIFDCDWSSDVCSSDLEDHPDTLDRGIPRSYIRHDGRESCVAKRLIASRRRWPEPPAPGWDRRYKARSGPPLSPDAMKAYRYDGRRIAPNHAPATNHAFQIDGVRR